MILSVEEIDGAVAGAKLVALSSCGEVQIKALVFDGTTAVLCGADAVDIAAVVGNDEHPGAIGDHSGIHSNRADTDGSAGGSDEITACIGMGVGGGKELGS